MTEHQVEIVETEGGEQVTVYTGPPEDVPRSTDGVQDDASDLGEDDGEEAERRLVGVMQRDTPATIAYLQTHETTAELGFDPDGMCQKIARTARNIGPGAASAFASQHMTPTQFRVRDISKIKRGSVGYFDDVADDNPFGHIVTWVGRVHGADRGSLNSLLCRSNSVVSGRVVVVRGSYFGPHWGDEFQFAGEWLNGVPLDLPDAPKPKPPPRPFLPAGGIKRLEHMVEVYDKMIDNHPGEPRVTAALRRDRREIKETIRTLRQRKG